MTSDCKVKTPILEGRVIYERYVRNWFYYPDSNVSSLYYLINYKEWKVGQVMKFQKIDLAEDPRYVEYMLKILDVCREGIDYHSDYYPNGCVMEIGKYPSATIRLIPDATVIKCITALIDGNVTLTARMMSRILYTWFDKNLTQPTDEEKVLMAKAPVEYIKICHTGYDRLTNDKSGMEPNMNPYVSTSHSAWEHITPKVFLG